jgi:2-polyprenyl-6-methoxyphenol hydroxylase-like FAD-dependent oxidoreductase
VRARLVVGADGRDSTVARLAGFVRRRDQPELLTAGVLVSGVRHPADQVHVHLDAACARMVIIVSPGPGFQRVYLI